MTKIVKKHSFNSMKTYWTSAATWPVLEVRKSITRSVTWSIASCSIKASKSLYLEVVVEAVRLKESWAIHPSKNQISCPQPIKSLRKAARKTSRLKKKSTKSTFTIKELGYFFRQLLISFDSKRVACQDQMTDWSSQRSKTLSRCSSWIKRGWYR